MGVPPLPLPPHAGSYAHGCDSAQGRGKGWVADSLHHSTASPYSSQVLPIRGYSKLKLKKKRNDVYSVPHFRLSLPDHISFLTLFKLTEKDE